MEVGPVGILVACLRIGTGFSAKKGLPLPLGRGVCETKSKNGRTRPRKPFISRVFCAQRGSETMV